MAGVKNCPLRGNDETRMREDELLFLGAAGCGSVRQDAVVGGDAVFAAGFFGRWLDLG